MIYSFSPFGYEGSLVVAEVDLRRGIPAVDIVGLADGAVAETRERVRSAIKNSNLEFPTERVLIGVSPADLRKEGTGFDLPIAVKVLEAQYGLEVKDDVFVMGELELSGNVRNVKAVQAGLSTAIASGILYAIIPHSDNLQVPEGMKVKTVSNLTEAYFALCDLAQGHYETFREYPTEKVGNEIEFDDLYEGETPLDEVFVEYGDEKDNLDGLKFALMVAASGKHNLITWGKPGCGKTMSLQMFPQILPKLTENELPSVKRIYSITGMPKKDRRRPFRMPHQTASIEGICGGGVTCRPGEISLAHNGVLFLDEAAEFRTSVLQMLRVPLENRNITLSRAGRSTCYPADFQLIMSLNPCPCGNYGSKDRICLCSAKSVQTYWNKLSAPLIDRLAIRYDCNNPIKAEILTLEEMRAKVKKAWEVQLARQGKLNDRLSPDEMLEYCKLTEDANKLFTRECEMRYLSPRSISNILKVARTVADMNGIETIDTDCVKTALSLRASTPLENM